MPWGFVAGAAAGLIGGVVSADASRSASHTQADAANKATDTQLQMFNTVNDQQKPYRDAGYTALGDISAGTAPGGYFSHQFNRDDLNANLAPNYQFMLEQGQGATANMANAMGGLGGNSLAEIARYTTGYAQNAYQQAYANYTANQTNIFNRLASIAGLGQTAGSNQTTGASTFGGNIANSQMGAGNALAAGQVGSANALSGGLSSAANWYGLSRFFPSSGGGGGGTGWATSNSGPGYAAEGGGGP